MDNRTKEHIRNIVQEIKAQRCIFFLGAGVSIEAGLPSGTDLAEMLARKRGWKYAGESLPEMAKKYSVVGGPVKPVIQEHLKMRLRKSSIRPQKSHRALAYMAERINVILTTNWDRLLEEAFESARVRDYVRIFRDAHLVPPQPKKTAIIKLHGDIDDADSLVVTEEDFAAFERRSPGLANALQNYLRTYTLVIVGYEQADANFKKIYDHVLEQRSKGAEHSLIYVVNPKEDLAWEQELRDKAQQRFIQMGATEFLTQVYEQVREIADRTPELQLGLQLIPYPCRKPIIEFCGPPGIGKSTLMEAIRKDYESCTPKDIHTAQIDFKNSDFREDSNAGYRVIWEELNKQLGMDVRYADLDTWANLLQRKGTVVLFFDTFERAPLGTARWLGTILKTLTDTAAELRAIFACRYPRLSKEWGFQIKSKVESKRLEPFYRVDDVRRQMEWYFLQDDDLALLVFDLTQGHPGLTQKAIDWLLQREIHGLYDLDGVARNELRHQIGELIDTYILEQVRTDVKPIIRHLAYHREFGWAEIGVALARAGVTQAGAFHNLNDFVRQQLKPTGLLDERARNYLPFSIDSTVRKLLVNLAWSHDTANFVTTHATIAAQHAEHAKRLDPNWYLYVVEYLYHTLQRLRGEQRVGQSINIPQMLISHLATIIQPIQDEDQLQHLEMALEQDEEMGTLLVAIQTDLPNQLAQVIKERGEMVKGG